MISILESFRNILTCNLRMFWKRGKKMKKGKKGLKFEFKKLEGKKILLAKSNTHFHHSPFLFFFFYAPYTYFIFEED